MAARLAGRLAALMVLAWAMPGQALVPRPILQAGHAGAVETAAFLRQGRVLATVDRGEVIFWDSGAGHVIDRVALPPPDAEHVAGEVVATARQGADELVLWQAQPRAVAAGAGRPRCRLMMLDSSARRWLSVTRRRDCRRPAALPAIAADGRQWRREGTGIVISGPGGEPVALVQAPRAPVTGAFLSTDAAMVASLQPGARTPEGCIATTRIAVWNAATAEQLPGLEPAGLFNLVRWIDSGRFVAVPLPPLPGCAGDAPPALLVQAASGTVLDTIPARPRMTPLGSAGDMLAMAPGTDGGPGAVLLRPAGGSWSPLPLAGAAPLRPRQLGAAFGGGALAVAGGPDDALEAALYRRRPDGSFGGPLPLWRAAAGSQEFIESLTFSRDDANIILVTDSGTGRRLRVWRARDGAALADVPIPNMIVSYVTGDAGMAIAGEAGAGTTIVLAAEGGGEVARLPFPGIYTATMLPQVGLLWTIDGTDVIRLFDRRTWALLLTVYRLQDGFLAVAPDGRYDSNFGADRAPFRWLMADAPWDSLAPTTYMRDYFTPGLYDKLVRCTAAGNCAAALPPLPDASTLNRLLPRLTVSARQVGDHAELTIADASPPGAGVHDVRVLRDGLLVARLPGGADPPADLPGWRAATDLSGQRQWTASIALPSGRSAVTLGAYAFNSDRVKGETAAAILPIVPLPPRRRRAFVVAIGADTYPGLAGKDLNFAAADARATAAMLSGIIDYRIVPVVLTSAEGEDRARRDLIVAVLARLGGDASAATAAMLAAAGVDPAPLTAANPDDAVIVSFAGHGWADAKGQFHLLPSDAATRPDGLPDPATLLASDRLAALLRGIDAGSIALIIDACHSAATVPAGFKPGPMGDAGLGQLAYDKQIRILAATQADDVAVEDAEAGHGLMTAVLLKARAALADPSGGVPIDRLLHAVVQRMPGEALALAEGRRARAAAADRERPPLLVTEGAVPPPPRFQQPALFDFAAGPAPVRLSVTGAAAP